MELLCILFVTTSFCQHHFFFYKPIFTKVQVYTHRARYTQQNDPSCGVQACVKYVHPTVLAIDLFQVEKRKIRDFGNGIGRILGRRRQSGGWMARRRWSQREGIVSGPLWEKQEWCRCIGPLLCFKQRYFEGNGKSICEHRDEDFISNLFPNKNYLDQKVEMKIQKKKNHLHNWSPIFIVHSI